MSSELLKKQENEYLTDLEIKNLIKDLSNADIIRLSQIAERNIWGCQMEADDLLQEVIVSILSGDRKFPRNVKPIAFFAQTMKSISSNKRDKLKRQKISTIMTEINDEEANNIINNIPENSVSYDAEIAATQQIEEIYELFKDDEDVTILLMARYDELSAVEICETTGWNRTQYETVNKRLRRGLNKRFPNGREK